MNMSTIIDLIAAREAAASTARDDLREQIIAVFTPNRGALRAKDVCRALGIGTEPRDAEGIRAKLRRLVNLHVLTETEPGLFTLTEKRA